MNLEILRLSRYVQAHQVDDDVIGLYHPFGHQIALVSTDCFDLLRSQDFETVPDSVFQDLAARNFLVPDGWEQTALDKYAEKPISGFFSLWLIVVQTCNIGCTYCVVEAETQTNNLPALPSLAKVKKGHMTAEVADRAVEVFRESLARHRQPVAKVTIYGGEPLLNRPLIKHIVPKIRALRWEGQQQPIEILCFTNGYSYDEELTKLFLENDVTVGMSLDGTKAINDVVRVDRAGRGTYDKVVQSYWKYREAGIRVGLSCTLGTHTKGELLNVVSHFVDDLKVGSIQFQTPIQVPEGSPNYLKMGMLARESLDAFDRARSAGVEEGLALRRLTSFAAGRFHHRDCAAVGGELAVTPDGTVGPCHNATIGGRQYFKGNVLQPGFNPEVLPAFVEWHNRMPINMPGCHGCSAIGLCGGGCPYNALVAEGSIWEKDPQQCWYMKEFIDWVLEDVWAQFRSAPRKQYAKTWRGSDLDAASRAGQLRVPVRTERVAPAAAML